MVNKNLDIIVPIIGIIFTLVGGILIVNGSKGRKQLQAL